jgi:hypothetical protein
VIQRDEGWVMKTIQASMVAAVMLGGLRAQVLAAPDDTLGVAHMSAVVATDGTFVANKSSGVIGSAKTAGGTYTIQFRREVTNCTYVASLGDTGTALPPVGSALVALSGTNSSTVFVETVNPAGALADASFHLIVFCAR